MRWILLLAGLAVAYAQSPEFDAVSIKAAAPAGGSSSSGGPGTKTPTVWTCQNLTLHNIVWIGFNLRSQQLVAPDWMHEPRFDITAKIPEGTTHEQFYLMFQKMLADRFDLKVHHTQKEVQGYELTIAKGGIKFKQSGATPANSEAPAESPTMRTDTNGFPVPSPGSSGYIITSSRAGGQWLHEKIDPLIRLLDSVVDKPVVDATGLAGTYDFSLHWVPDRMQTDAALDGPDIFVALEKQLGLKLTPKKVSIPIVVVDHAEKLPKEN
jgi:uncharacterized protein (TIGR03435 family)